MLVRTDDEVYRVDAVWLGPPRATFPWRARYVSYGVGLLVIMLIMMVQRRLGIGLDFFSVAWALVGTVAITRFLGKKIDYERPLGQVLGQFWAEVTGPRAGRRSGGGSVRAGHVRVRTSRAHPGQPPRGGRPRPWKVADRSAAPALPDTSPATGGQFGRPVATKGALVGAAAGPATTPRRSPAGGTVVDVTGETEPAVPVVPAQAEPERVVPPLPEPGSAPRQGRFRRARGRGRGRGATTPARVSRPEPWRKGGHRGRT
ncbi:hypothetical protein Ae168Ps1_3296c [Pseudonocardia sp. Ae168_Ps1]|uniref:hypothetical protein n=1 Tax=unclassified Pseudonocardia TaxID=2619320 RepID=UPI0007613850|nr:MULTISPECIES: hypothetical protein [unclassified Pseudonocardia]OLL74898.1 hypothetical protein Ae150APs1_3276c [Pseudonocardia sp. Ae150A_Ps1]OLL80890.1 hypothetical protein Ae168Ps1_3296c [Pseudonocardia sp. Ae168_Ps1]OLL84992.1 hypothetical protein Ae263Ps1_2047 [Pseudonocardia sp. Ae263_Ps1]OLL94991.1 hypothetical protein Ae356Ps1_4888c [Pseudonocardia sp. Ae356_Ps1]